MFSNDYLFVDSQLLDVFLQGLLLMKFYHLLLFQTGITITQEMKSLRKLSLFFQENTVPLALKKFGALEMEDQYPS